MAEFDHSQLIAKAITDYVFILVAFNFFSIFAIFPLSFLSFLILSAARLHAWATPDSQIPKYVPISFSFSPVYL